MGMKWKKGMRVIKIFHGLGDYTETQAGTIGKVDLKKGIVYFANDEETEQGITYDLNGRERENFFPPMWSEIKPAQGENNG